MKVHAKERSYFSFGSRIRVRTEDIVMNFSALSSTQIEIIVAIVLMAAVGIAILLSLRKRYRAAHHTAVRQTRGLASTEELRQAMIHYRTLFEELIREPAVVSPYNA
jgi:hypothetical protein